MPYAAGMSQSLSQDIAKVVRGLLAERMMTVQEFATLMGEPNSSVARWINQGGNFKTDKLDEMADALGIDVADLVLLAISKRQPGGSTRRAKAEAEDLRRAVERTRPKAREERKRNSGTG